MSFNIEDYEKIRSGGSGYYYEQRGLIAVWGKEAVQFLDGMISNDMKTLEDGEQMLAAFPNAKGRLLAVVRVQRNGDRFLIETEEATREKVFQNLFRFTFAGDFFVEDLSEDYRYFELFIPDSRFQIPDLEDFILFNSKAGKDVFVANDLADRFAGDLVKSGLTEVGGDLYETLRIESGIPKYGVDMDETTIVSELGIDGLISYDKGCYIGQEIIARIHFRGHVAKQLTGLVLSEPVELTGGLMSEADNPDASETLALQSKDGKNAGKITSVTFSPALDKTIALAYVRYEFLEEGTKLATAEHTAEVKALPFL